MKALRDHETYQMAMLQWLASKRFLGSLAFEGGTMLRLCHELPRFSLDMGFCFFKQQNYETFYNRLSRALSQDHDVVDCRNSNSSILVQMPRQPGMPKFEMEFRKCAAPPGTTEEKIAFSPYFPTQVLVRGITLQQTLLSMTQALIDHGDIAYTFDLEFLLRKGTTLNLPSEHRTELMGRLKEFNNNDLHDKLGDLLLPEVRDYYKREGFSYLEQALSYEG